MSSAEIFTEYAKCLVSFLESYNGGNLSSVKEWKAVISEIQ